MKKISWYVGVIVGTAALVVVSTGPASAAGSRTAAEVASTIHVSDSTRAVVNRPGLKPRIWEW